MSFLVRAISTPQLEGQLVLQCHHHHEIASLPKVAPASCFLLRSISSSSSQVVFVLLWNNAPLPYWTLVTALLKSRFTLS